MSMVQALLWMARMYGGGWGNDTLCCYAEMQVTTALIYAY